MATLERPQECVKCPNYTRGMIPMSVIEDIKVEITEIRDRWKKKNLIDEADALNAALKIIDKHTK